MSVLLCLDLMRFKVSADSKPKADRRAEWLFPSPPQGGAVTPTSFLLQQASRWLPGRKPELAPRLPGLCFGLPSTSGQPDTNPSIHLTDNGKTGLSFVPSWNAKARSAQRVEYGLCESRGGSKGLLLASRGRYALRFFKSASERPGLHISQMHALALSQSSAFVRACV